MRILVLAGDADGNLGDQAIREATVRAINCLRPQAEITLSSRRPAEVRGNNLHLLPRGPRALPGLLAAMRRADLVLVGGGGLFQDDDSLVKMPYWGALTVLARLGGGRVAGYALGMGPLDAWSSRLVARVALAAMARVTVRDRLAAALAAALGSREPEVLPDPALLLTPASRQQAQAVLEEAGVPRDGRPLIGVACRRWWPLRRRIIPRKLAWTLGLPQPRDGRGEMRFTVRFAELLRRLAEARDAFVVFLPSYNVSHEGDAVFAREIAACMPGIPHAHLGVADARLYAALCREVDFLLAGRMHPAILATAVGTPAFGLAYNPKFAGFFELIGHPERMIAAEALVAGGEAVEIAFTRALAAWREGAPDPERIGALQRRILRQTDALLAAA